jgi:prepilin-type N-terminal cleavage/methylation domain-containing protein
MIQSSGRPQYKGNQGFTLIEVLIAAIILFSSIALVAQLFSASSLSSRKATKVAQYNQVVPLVNKMIKIDIQQRAIDRSLANMEGKMHFFNIDFIWRAERISFLPPPMSADDVEPWSDRFGLYNVSVITQQQNKQSQYSFNVATW